MKQSCDKPKYPPNLYKVGNSWMIDFVFRGQRYRENIGPVSKTIAKEIRDRRKRAIAEGRLEITEQVKDLPFPTALEKYLEYYEANRRPRSYERHVHSGTKLKAFFGNSRLSSISSFMIEKYKRERKEAKAADATVNRELALLKNLFNMCIKWGFARKNPVREVKMYREDNGRTRYLSQEEAQALLTACNPDLRVVVLTAMHTGFRKSEIMSLCWSSVDMRNHSITVESCYAKNAETRTVPITDDLFDALRQLKSERDRDSDDLVFINRYGKPWTDWRTAFGNAVDRAGLKDFRFHDLRHCYGSWLAMSGVSGKAQMELMGHKDPKMTMRYTHLSMDYKRDFVAKLPKLGVESPQISPSTDEAKVVGFSK